MSMRISILLQTMAVVASTTATIYIPHKSFTPKNIFSTSLSFCQKRCNNTSTVNSSSDLSAETSPDIDFESSIDVPKGPPSLISVINVEKALRGIPITDVDHYGRLGIQRGGYCSNIDEVTAAYNSKIEELKKQDLDEEEFSKKMEFLKESYTILSSVEDRRLYDWSLARSTNAGRYAWPFEVDPIEESAETPSPQEAEDVRPTRWVGYGLLGWLILSIALSIAFNR